MLLVLWAHGPDEQNKVQGILNVNQYQKVVNF